MVRAMTSTSQAPEVDAVGFLADLDSLGGSNIGQHCTSARALNDLPEDLRGPVDTILWTRPDVSTASLTKVLAKHGVKVDAANLARHRRRGPYGCKCPGKPEAAAE
jgi:hypothetical protein